METWCAKAVWGTENHLDSPLKLKSKRNVLLSNHDHHCTVILVPDSWTGLAKSLETELENIHTDVALQNITIPLKFEELIFEV